MFLGKELFSFQYKSILAFKKEENKRYLYYQRDTTATTDNKQFRLIREPDNTDPRS
jgi:hypothetical protein